jgi:hypothetical protein
MIWIPHQRQGRSRGSDPLPTPDPNVQFSSAENWIRFIRILVKLKPIRSGSYKSIAVCLVLWIRIHWIRIRVRIPIHNLKWIRIWIQIRIQSGYRALVTKNWRKKYSWNVFLLFLRSKITIYLSLVPHKGLPIYRETFSLHKRTFSTSNNEII